MRDTNMLSYLIRNRCRPKVGSFLWIKYWLKRARLSGELVSQIRLHRRFAKQCHTFGERNALSRMTIMGRMDRLSIGDDCAIGKASIQLHDQVSIGNAVAINDGVNIITGSHDINAPNWPLITGRVTVEDYAWLATGSAVLPNVTIGRGAVVGAFAVVAKSVPPLAIVVGNPAKIVGYRNECEFSYRPNHLYALFEAWIGTYPTAKPPEVSVASRPSEPEHAASA